LISPASYGIIRIIRNGAMISKEEWKIRWFFEELDTYIKALVTNMNSKRVEDLVRLTELRETLIDRLVSREFE